MRVFDRARRIRPGPGSPALGFLSDHDLGDASSTRSRTRRAPTWAGIRRGRPREDESDETSGSPSSAATSTRRHRGAVLRGATLSWLEGRHRGDRVRPLHPARGRRGARRRGLPRLPGPRRRLGQLVGSSCSAGRAARDLERSSPTTTVDPFSPRHMTSLEARRLRPGITTLSAGINGRQRQRRRWRSSSAATIEGVVIKEDYLLDDVSFSDSQPELEAHPRREARRGGREVPARVPRVGGARGQAGQGAQGAQLEVGDRQPTSLAVLRGEVLARFRERPRGPARRSPASRRSSTASAP